MAEQQARETRIELKDGWFETTTRSEGRVMAVFGPEGGALRHEVWRLMLPTGGTRFYVVRVDSSKKGERRTLLLEAPADLAGAVELDAEGLRSRDAADLTAKVLQLTGAAEAAASAAQ